MFSIPEQWGISAKLREKLDSAKDAALYNASPEQKRWLAIHSPDIDTRRELMQQGWLSDEMTKAIKEETRKLSLNMSSYGGEYQDIVSRYDLSPKERRELIAAERITKRELLSPTEIANRTVGDTYENISNSSAQTNAITVYQSIAASDPVVAAQEVVGGLQKFLYPGDFQPGIFP